VDKKILVSDADIGKRLDRFVFDDLKILSRSKIKFLIESGSILVNTSPKKASYSIKNNDLICVSYLDDSQSRLQPYEFSVEIIHEDEDVLVINKPQGLSSHPPNPSQHDSLVNALIYMKKDLAIVDPMRPGIVHRLDKDTSGIMVLAKNEFAYNSLVGQFKKREIKKEYRAIVWGQIKQDDISCDLPLKRDAKNRLKMKIGFIDGKVAKTEAKVIKRFKDSTYVSVKILTGRMHQIRVHLNFLGFPIVGDPKYGKKDNQKSLLLHSHNLGFFHPKTNNFMEFTVEVPKRFDDFIKERSDA